MLEGDVNGNAGSRPSKSKAAKMPIPRQCLIHLLMVALVVLASTAMSCVVGGSKSNRPQHQPRQAIPSSAPDASMGATVEATGATAVCMTADAANPIKEIFPMNVTGVLNATLTILPITMEAARRVIPAQYAILERPLRAALPNFPAGMYPVLLQTAHDHDVGLHGMGFKIDDFSKAGFEFPFIDLLGDGYSSFRWAPTQFLSGDNEMAIGGSRQYGTVVHPATFEPACDAFARTADGSKLVFSAKSTEAASSLTLEFTRTSGDHESQPYPVAFFRNITNQPIFADGQRQCDQMIRLFNTSLSQGARGAPAAVTGHVSVANIGPLGDLQDAEVKGIHVVTAFVENNYLDCHSLKGYMGTGGVGDSNV